MNVIVSNASDKPIYEQIYAQIKGAILRGECAEGEALPSIRALAKELRISVITTKRAFDDLERDGFICNHAYYEETVKKPALAGFLFRNLCQSAAIVVQ